MFQRIVMPNRYEKAMCQASSKGGKLGKAVAGISRAARLSSARDSAHDQVIWDIGADIIGPMTFFFIWWVLEEARKKGIERLYFYARDGDLMIKVARMLKKEWGYDTELMYLYGSRGIWFPLAVSEMGDFEWSWLSSGFIENVTLDEIRKRLMLDRNKLADFLKKCDFNVVDWSKDLDEVELKKLRSCLLHSSFSSELAYELDGEFNNAVSYFLQEKLFDGARFAVVDTGWGARCQCALSAIMDKAGRYPQRGIDGFYIGVSGSKVIYKNDRLHSFLFDWSRDRVDPRLSNFLFFELLMSTDQGRTVMYRDTAGHVGPVLDNVGVKEAIEWGVRTQHESAVRFTELALKYVGRDEFDKPASADLIKKILTLFMYSPSKEEADVYGEYMIAAEILERDFQKFAPRMRYSDILDVLTKRAKFRGFWIEGILARSGFRFFRILWEIATALGIFSFIKRFILKCS